MLIAGYVVVAFLVVWLSIKASQYIDMIDKTTKISGAFLGGVLLSAVTSLPELFTSISATVIFNTPELCIGNILGSNLFNLLILAVMSIVFIRSFAKAKVARSHYFVVGYVLLIYAILILNWLDIMRVELWSVSLTSILIVVVYFLGVRHLSGEDGENEESDETITLSPRQIVWRFVLSSIGLIGLSVLLTWLTDSLAERYNIGAGLAGALFLGVATSLPELSSTITLFRLKNFNIAIGNIVGSNLFNFTILAIADLLAFRTNIYVFADHKIVNLLVIGALAMPVLVPLFASRKGWVKVLFSGVIAAGYVVFLIL